MFKKLLVLVLALFLFLSPAALACEDGQSGVLMKGMKVIQIMPDRSLRGVTVPSDVNINIGPELNEDMVQNLNSQTDMDWTGGNLGIIEVDFGQGPTPVMLVVKDSDVRDCK